GNLYCLLVTCICVAHDSCTRIGNKNTGNLLRSEIRSVSDKNLACMDGIPHPHTSTVMDAYPTCTAGCIDKCIQERPVRDCVTAVLHGFRFPVRGSNGTTVKMVTAEDNRCADLAVCHHFIHFQGETITISIAQPANAGREALP